MTYYRLQGGLKLSGKWRPKWVSAQASYWTSATMIGTERVPTGAAASYSSGITTASNNNGEVFIGASQASKGWVYTWGTTDYGSEVSLNGDAQSGAQFGASASIDGTWMAVGAPQWISGTRYGVVFAYHKSSTWSSTPTQTIAPPSADFGNGVLFGTSVAIYGTTMVIGAPGFSSSKGKVYIYDYGTSWTLTKSLTITGGGSSDQFGFSVSIYDDTIVVGAKGVNSTSGAVYVYKKVSGIWPSSPDTTITSPLTSAGFGHMVKLADTTHFVVGAPGNSAVTAATATTANAGRVYVYSKSGSNWNLDQTVNVGRSGDGYFITDTQLTTTTGRDQNRTGWYVDYRNEPEGTQSLLIGGPRNRSDATSDGNARGATYVVERVNGTWQTTNMTNSKVSISGLANNSYFGRGCAFDGKRIIVGVPGSGTSSSRGSWYAYKH